MLTGPTMAVGEEGQESSRTHPLMATECLTASPRMLKWK